MLFAALQHTHITMAKNIQGLQRYKALEQTAETKHKLIASM